MEKKIFPKFFDEKHFPEDPSIPKGIIKFHSSFLDEIPIVHNVFFE